MPCSLPPPLLLFLYVLRSSPLALPRLSVLHSRHPFHSLLLFPSLCPLCIINAFHSARSLWVPSPVKVVGLQGSRIYSSATCPNSRVLASGLVASCKRHQVRMEQAQELVAGIEGVQQPDVVALIFRQLSEPQDVLAAAAVCRTWRAAATDLSQLRSWQYDDDSATAAGIKSSATPMQPKTPLPKHWVNPTTHSPFSSFKTPRSLAMLSAPSPIRSLLWPCDRLTDANAVTSNIDENGPSPRTPSPVQPVAPGGSFLDIVLAQMVIGKFVGDVDISSSRLNDKSLQTIFKSCPRLHTLRLQHLCVPSMYPSNTFDLGPSPLRVGDIGPDNYILPPVLSCGCGQLSERGFAAVRWHCSDLSSVTLVLQHVISKKVYRQVLSELGALPKLHTLSVELRMPSFGQSVKSQLIWQENTHCTDKELLALLNAGPPPLSALALNRCDLTEASISALASSCPNLEAIDLRSSSDIQGEHDIPLNIGALFQNLTCLSAAALGVFQTPEKLPFESWVMPALKRLRLETVEPLSLSQLQTLKCACARLESLHLISGTHATLQESHIYPVTDDTILEHGMLNSLSTF
ncbi:uncharacterized protein [Physcomitrium patens]|uniref:F-box domain-containing protein n=1 Tax=Physcomitrium patens TaxID=3218 RepID=A0A2K1ID49_PHYPA|nr:uncharacterized protein LOC112277728 [Physcomitrium patens]PNR27205.1 hypothetical protein PHYPA_030686 [Physcomitrium patens]|eukprot:XP_024366163.1 uncharacterized protein LOC112277728 [Physcomitrella patens]